MTSFNNGLKVNVIKGASAETITSAVASCLASKSIAIEKANEASVSANSAESIASMLTTQASISTTQATIATTKANEALGYRDAALTYQYGAESAYSSTLSLVNNLELPSVTHTVDTVDDFGTVPNGIDTVIVKDLNRGGTFIYDATESAVNNGGTVFDGWVRQYSGAVNVKWFGAKGDGTTEDTLAIENALNTKKSIYAPEGTYIVTRTLFPWKQNITGCSQEKTIFKASGDFHVFQILRENGWSLTRKAVIFSNFTVYGGGITNNSYAFLAYGVDGNISSPLYCFGLTIQDVYLELIGGGIYVSDFFRFNVFRVGMSGVTNPLKVVGSVVQSTFDRIINNFDNSVPSTLENVGFRFVDKSYLVPGLQGGENCTIMNCSAAANHIGLKITGVSLLFKAQNLDLDFVRDYGIYCDNHYFTFENIWIAVQNPTTKSRGLYVGVQSTVEPGKAVFKKLRIQAYAVTSDSNAIEVGDGVNYCNGVDIKESFIDATGSSKWNYGIFLNKVDNNVILDNTIKSDSIQSDYAIFGVAKNSSIIGNVSPTKKIKVKPASISSYLKITDNNVLDGNGDSTRYISNSQDYITNTGTHTVVVDNLFNPLGNSVTIGIVELTLTGIDPIGSNIAYAKYFLPILCNTIWSIETPTKIYGTDITIVLVSSTSSSLTLTVSSPASTSSLSVYAQITAQGDGILILK